MKKLSQGEKIIHAFLENNNELTPSQIMRLGIAQYNTRIFELKKDGHIIENIKLGTHDGVLRTKFVYRGKKGDKVDFTPPSPPQNFPSNAYKIAHENRIKKEREKEVLTGQSSLF